MGKDYPGIQRLKNNGSNWHQYRMQLRAYLRSEGLLHIIQEDAGPPLYQKLQKEEPTIPIDQIPEYNKDNDKVCSVILGTVNNKILTALKHKQTAKDYIEHLKQMFEARSIFAIKATRPAATASGTNIKDSWIADSCLDIHIGNDIKTFMQYKEIEPFQIWTGEGLTEAIGIGSVELTVARTDHSAHIITFTEVYHCPSFLTNIISLRVLRGKGAFFNDLRNTINYVKNRAEVAYIPCINGLNSFILLDDPVRPRLIEEFPTKDAVPEVSQALQERCEASQSLQEGNKASRALKEEDEVSQASQSGGDSQSRGAAEDHDIAPQPDRPLTDDELSSEPVVDIIRRIQEADEVSRASLSGGDSQSGGASGDQDIAPQPNRPPLTDEEQAGLNQQELPDLGGHLRQEGTPSRDIYQEDLEQNLAEYSEDEAEPIQASLDARDMVNARTRSKPRLDYSVLHKTGRKELATKATYLTPAFAYTFASALSQPQWTRTTKGLPPEPRNWKKAMNSVFKKEWKTAADEE